MFWRHAFMMAWQLYQPDDFQAHAIRNCALTETGRGRATGAAGTGEATQFISHLRCRRTEAAGKGAVAPPPKKQTKTPFNLRSDRGVSPRGSQLRQGTEGAADNQSCSCHLALSRGRRRAHLENQRTW